MTNSEKDLILSWANYNQKLSHAFRRYLDKELFCNVTLSAEGKTIKCHQEILSACSNWFEKTLSSIESFQHPIILLKDVTYKELNYIVNFMYSGEAIVPQEEIQSFLKTAELLEIKGLLENPEETKVDKSSSTSTKGPPTCFNNGELTVTAKKVEKDDSSAQLNNLVIYNQISSHLPTLKPGKTNPLVRAYEANNKRKPSESSHESKKSSRTYEANAPVFDNRHIYASDLVQSHFEYSGDGEIDQTEDPPPASGIEDCGPFKKVWSYRYLCYNLGKEILCLLCFCRFTQFKKFNLDRHMRNKHPHLYHIDDEAKKRVLDMYVARYEENVTPGMIASVPSQGNEQMAAGILQVGPIQLEAILGETDGLFADSGAGPLHPMMEGDDLLECQLGDEDGEEMTMSIDTSATTGGNSSNSLVKQERIQF